MSQAVKQRSLRAAKSSLPRKPALRPSVRISSDSNGRLRISSPRTTYLLIRDPDGRVLAMLELLDGTRELDQVADALGVPEDELAAVVEQLNSYGLLEDGSIEPPPSQLEPYLEQFDRQIALFSDWESDDLTRYDLQQRLKDAHVVQLGVGGVGSWCTLGIAATGVGRLTLLDVDTVELSNLNRQVLFTPDDIGCGKTTVAREVLARLSPEMEVETVDMRIDSPQQLLPYLDGADFVISTLDRPIREIRLIVNEAMQRTGTAGTFASHTLPFARVGPLVVPGKQGCMFCLEAELERKDPHYDLPSLNAQLVASPVSIAPASCTVAALAVRQATRYLTVRDETHLGTLLTVNVLTLAMNHTSPSTYEGCRWCC